ncbi:Hsp33 family molecular chaperone HslO [Thermodesulfobacteriota bacterium]
MKDYLIRIITKKANVRALVGITTHLVNEACRLHGAYPTASAAFGRALTGACLMGAMLKNGQRIALKFEGNGPLKKIIAEADSKGAVKGYVQEPTADPPKKAGKLDVAGALGRVGLLTVTKDLRLREPYRGVVQLHSGEIAEDLAYYFRDSEQIPSAVGLGVFVEPDGQVSAAGGFLIQSFPPYDEKTVDALIERIRKIPPITELLQEGRTPEEILEILFKGISYDFLEKRELAFRCSCGKEVVERALLILGPKEITSLIQEHGEVDVACEFCRRHHYLSREDLERLATVM